MRVDFPLDGDALANGKWRSSARSRGFAGALVRSSRKRNGYKALASARARSDQRRDFGATTSRKKMSTRPVWLVWRSTSNMPVASTSWLNFVKP